MRLAQMARNGEEPEIRALVLALEKQVADRTCFSMARVWRQNEQLKLIVQDLIELFDHANFSNGVTDSTGSIDEGEVRSWEYFDQIRKRYENVIQ